MPHRIESRAEVRPTVRRFAMAPFEGILRQSEVHTGDIVKSGQTIARMDEDEIRLQLSGIIAEKERVFKAKSSALASGETLEKQKAKLEYQRLQLQQELLEARIENLELNSPIDGVVLKNDFEDAEGAPLDKGQVVAEIAPLDQMRFQIFVSQWDIAHVNEGASVTIRFDGMVQPVAGTISRILPAATTYETESVFVVEVEVENLLGELRPGMRGYATIQAGYQSAGWILFRKPLRFVSRAFGY